MRKLTLAAAVLAALAAATVAVAHGIRGAGSATSVAATFSAAAAKTTSWSCTTSDSKSIVVTQGTYSGTATGSADLSGPITLTARSVVDASDNIGTVAGTFRIDVAKGGDTRGVFTVVYDHGSVAGLLAGRAHEPAGRLLANVSATFAAAGGFTNGRIGSGSTGGGAVELGLGPCRPSGTAQPGPPAHEAQGAISAISAGSITVAGLTCAIPQTGRATAILPKLALRVGDRVAIRCRDANGQTTLIEVEKLR